MGRETGKFADQWRGIGSRRAGGGVCGKVNQINHCAVHAIVEST